MLPHHPTLCRGCGAALSGDDPEPLRHQVVEIPAIVPFVIEHQLHRLSCPCCRTVTAAVLPVGVERGGYGPRLSSLVGLLGIDFHLSHRKVQGLLDQVLSIRFGPASTGAASRTGSADPPAPTGRERWSRWVSSEAQDREPH